MGVVTLTDRPKSAAIVVVNEHFVGIFVVFVTLLFGFFVGVEDFVTEHCFSFKQSHHYYIKLNLFDIELFVFWYHRNRY